MTNGSSVPSPADDSSGAEEHSEFSYEELESTARAIASNMQRRGAPGGRIAARAIGIRRSTTEGQPASASDATSQSGTLHKKSTSLDGSVWKFVTRTSLGGVETYLWHRQGTNEFCWRPVGTPWGAGEMPLNEPQ